MVHHHHIHKSSTFNTILSHFSPDHILQLILFETHFNIVPPYMFKFLRRSLLQMFLFFSDKLFYPLLFSLYWLTVAFTYFF